jgi:hypothetical protein
VLLCAGLPTSIRVNSRGWHGCSCRKYTLCTLNEATRGTEGLTKTGAIWAFQKIVMTDSQTPLFAHLLDAVVTAENNLDQGLLGRQIHRHQPD